MKNLRESISSSNTTLMKFQQKSHLTPLYNASKRLSEPSLSTLSQKDVIKFNNNKPCTVAAKSQGITPIKTSFLPSSAKKKTESTRSVFQVPQSPNQSNQLSQINQSNQLSQLNQSNQLSQLNQSNQLSQLNQGNQINNLANQQNQNISSPIQNVSAYTHSHSQTLLNKNKQKNLFPSPASTTQMQLQQLQMNISLSASNSGNITSDKNRHKSTNNKLDKSKSTSLKNYNHSFNAACNTNFLNTNYNYGYNSSNDNNNNNISDRNNNSSTNNNYNLNIQEQESIVTKMKTIPKFKKNLASSDSIEKNIDLNLNNNINNYNSQSKNVVSIKIQIFSNWGHPKKISSSELDILGPNRFPIPIKKIFIDPLSHKSKNINYLINGDLIKEKMEDIWFANWPPISPLRFITMNLKVSSEYEVESLRLWPNQIDPTMNIKEISIFVDENPVFNGELSSDFGLVIPLNMKTILRELRNHERKKKKKEKKNKSPEKENRNEKDYNSEDDNNNKGKNNEDNNNDGDSEEDENDEDRSDVNETKQLLYQKLMKVRRTLPCRLFYKDKVGMEYPLRPIHILEFIIKDSYEANGDSFGLSRIRVYGIDGKPLDVRNMGEVECKNCGKCPHPMVLFREYDDPNVVHFDAWKGDFVRRRISQLNDNSFELFEYNYPNNSNNDLNNNDKNNNNGSNNDVNNNSNNDDLNNGLNSNVYLNESIEEDSKICVKFSDFHLIGAIIVITFRHNKLSGMRDISAKTMAIRAEGKEIWTGRLKHSYVTQKEMIKENDCSTVVFLTEDLEIQKKILDDAFPAMRTFRFPYVV